MEVVFPVAREAITTGQQTVSEGPVSLPDGLAVVPGPPAGEGCSQEGGCAACPYMKMNNLRSLPHTARTTSPDCSSASRCPCSRPNVVCQSVGRKVCANQQAESLVPVNEIAIMHSFFSRWRKDTSAFLRVSDVR